MDSTPYFFRIDSASFLRMMLKFKSDRERGKFIKQFAFDLMTCSSANEYTQEIINEAIEYIGKKRRAGKKGGDKKASNAKAPLEQCYDFATSKTPSKTVANKQLAVSNKTLKPYSEEFEKFWAEYPRGDGKGKAWESWQKIKPPIDEVLFALNWQKKSEQWVKDNGQFIPMPTTYLNQRRWEDKPPPPKTNGQPSWI